MHIFPPSEVPISAARREPAASRTACMSRIRSSRVGNPTLRSDRPVPRLSNRINREKALEHMCQRRKHPGVIQIGYRARHIDDIERAIAYRLIGDVQSVTSCVACARSHRTKIPRRINARIGQCRGSMAASAKSESFPFPFTGDRIGVDSCWRKKRASKKQIGRCPIQGISRGPRRLEAGKFVGCGGPTQAIPPIHLRAFCCMKAGRCWRETAPHPVDLED